jgi:hypothetical protein
MRNQLTVQEHICETILSKNLGYIDKELKSLKAIDYRMFTEADKWLKNATAMLDNFNSNANVPNFIAFNMLAGAKIAQEEEADGEDLLLNAPDDSSKSDVVTHGEHIADKLSSLQNSKPSDVATRLERVTLEFAEETIAALDEIAKCSAIEGVEMSNEELEALRDAASAKASAL